MTNEAIDKLEGLELSQEFVRAFSIGPEGDNHVVCTASMHSYDRSLDAVLAALPEDWRIALIGGNDGTGWVATVLPRNTDSSPSAMAPIPATAVCRAALKAKGGDA